MQEKSLLSGGHGRLRSVLLDLLPCSTNVFFVSIGLANTQANCIPTIELGVRYKELARSIQLLQQGLADGIRTLQSKANQV